MSLYGLLQRLRGVGSAVMFWWLPSHQKVSIPRIVDVTFNLNGRGNIVERYDRLSANDMACWVANGAIYPQICVDTVKSDYVPKAQEQAFHDRCSLVLKGANIAAGELRR